MKNALVYSSNPSEERCGDLAAYSMVGSIFMGIMGMTMLAKEASVLNKITSWKRQPFVDKCCMVKLNKSNSRTNPIVIDYGSALLESNDIYDTFTKHYENV